MAADATHPKGTVYFMENDDVRSTTRQWAFASAVKALEGTAVRGAIVDGSLPSKKDDVAGAMVGSAGVDWRSSGSTILPGAICEHLTSYGGIMTEGAGQTPLTEFLRYGAAGSSGTVVEPMSMQAKFPYCVHARALRPRRVVGRSVSTNRCSGPINCSSWATRSVSRGPSGWPSKCPGCSPARRCRDNLCWSRACRESVTSQSAVDHFEVFVDGKRLATEPASRTADAGLRRRWVTGGMNCASWRLPQDSLETQSRVVATDCCRQSRRLAVTLARENSTAPDVPYGEPLVVRAKAAACQVHRRSCTTGERSARSTVRTGR